MIIQLTEENFDKEVFAPANATATDSANAPVTAPQSNGVNCAQKAFVLVDFFAPWCNPCKLMHPVLEEIAKEYATNLKICTVDVSAQIALAEKMRVLSVPTLLLVKNGKIIWRESGAHTKQELCSILQENGLAL